MSSRKRILVLGAAVALSSFSFGAEKAPSFAELNSEFELMQKQGKPVDRMKQLIGPQWKLIARYRAPHTNEIFEDQYNTAGIKSDQNELIGLTFKKEAGKYWVEIGGNEADSPFRGPFEVTIAKDKIAYSDPSYTEDTNASTQKSCKFFGKSKRRMCTDSHFVFACRLSSSANDLVCSLVFKIDAMNSDLDAMKDMNNKVVGYYKLQKSN